MLQAIGNLTTNALKYGRDPVTISARAEEQSIVVTIHNDGPAIRPEQVPTLFEPFRHGPDHAGRRGGLGLGLYIVSEIMRAHGGRVDVESSDRDGTTLALHWPTDGGAAER